MTRKQNTWDRTRQNNNATNPPKATKPAPMTETSPTARAGSSVPHHSVQRRQAFQTRSTSSAGTFQGRAPCPSSKKSPSGYKESYRRPRVGDHRLMPFFYLLFHGKAERLGERSPGPSFSLLEARRRAARGRLQNKPNTT